MKEKRDLEFLGRRMKNLRENNDVTMEEIAKRIDDLEGTQGRNKSSISRAESGKSGEKTIMDLAEKYCQVFELSELQRQQLFRGEKIVIPDTSALLYNTQLIEELSSEYSKVIIPKTVIDELIHIKNHKGKDLGKKAWQVISSIKNSSVTLQREYTGERKSDNNDWIIICIAKEVAEEFDSNVDIITNDVDYSAYLKGNENINAIHLREYRATKQSFVNMAKIKEIDKLFDDSYENISTLNEEEANAYFNNGYSDGVTLIISTVRNRSVPIELRKKKIKWLIDNGADVNKRDCYNYYFPPLSHAAQMGDFEMFKFLLKECGANPNTGSLNPHGANKIRQKNEGNMPLMIVSYFTEEDWIKEKKKKKDFEKILKLLCEDKRTSLNQQDGNGFTALIKACANGNAKCRDILINAGADTKIVDLNGHNYEDHWNEYLEYGPLRERNKRQNEEKR